MKIPFKGTALYLVICALLLGCVLWLVQERKNAPVRKSHTPVMFFPRASKEPLPLDSAESAVIHHLAAKLKDGGNGVIKHKLFLTASIGTFKIGEEQFEWYDNILYQWDSSAEVYKILKDARLGQCFNALRATHSPFDPSQITASEWSQSLTNLK